MIYIIYVVNMHTFSFLYHFVDLLESKKVILDFIHRFRFLENNCHHHLFYFFVLLKCYLNQAMKAY